MTDNIAEACRYETRLDEFNEILAEAGEKPTTRGELERAGIDILDEVEIDSAVAA